SVKLQNSENATEVRMRNHKLFTAAVFAILTAGLAVRMPGQDAAQANVVAAAPSQMPQPTAPVTPPAPAAQQPQANPPGIQSQQVPETTVPLRVMTNKSILINTAERMKRVSITDPSVADAVVVTPNQIMIHGRSPGEVTLVVWDEQDRSR